MIKKTAIVLAGGYSKRFGEDKGLVLLAGKTLVSYVVERVNSIVNETLVIVSSEKQKHEYSKVLPKQTKLFVDVTDSQSPLVGAMTGLKEATGAFSILLACDTPFISTKILQLLYDLCKGKSAVIPRWPTGYIEPLQAVYETKPALLAAKQALSQKNMNMQSMIANLKKVRYVSTMLLEQIEPKLETFFNINTIEDLKNAKTLLK